MRVIALGLLVLSGCSILDPPPVSYQFYVLDALADASESERKELAAGTPVVSIGRIVFPDYLRREALAKRTADHQIEYSTTDRWAEPLQQAFERVLRQQLAAELGGHGIAVQAASFSSPADYVLQVDVRRFERVNDTEAVLAARWAVRAEGEVLFADELTLRQALEAPTSDAAASALSATVAKLAGSIAEQVQRLVLERDRRSAVLDAPRP